MPFSNLEIALASLALLACLVAGGAWLRRGQPGDDLPSLEEQAAFQPAEAASLLTKCTALEAERSETQSQFQQLQAECNDAREEAELILLQLHQVQEELEHYFLVSQDLQQQLDQAQAINDQPSDRASIALANDDTNEKLQRIKHRLSYILQEGSSSGSSLWALIHRQQVALTRFQQLHQMETAAIPAPSLCAVLSAPISDGDVVMI